MSIDVKLLEILRCPLTKQSLYPLSSDRLDDINAKILSGDVRYEDGSIVSETIEEGLVTANETRIYRIDSGIPIMLHEQSIRLQTAAPDTTLKD